MQQGLTIDFGFILYSFKDRSQMNLFYFSPFQMQNTRNRMQHANAIKVREAEETWFTLKGLKDHPVLLGSLGIGRGEYTIFRC